MSAGGVVAGPDGRLRCSWGVGTPDYVRYHDEEWGRPVTGEDALYERLTLEAFQSGLSWLTILRKREGFRAAFAGFAAERVAAFVDDDVERLLADAGIVRNRAKIEAAIANARATVALHDAGESLRELVWSHAPEDRPAPRSLADVPAQTPESKALAKALKARGFRFVGPTTLYAAMQACGVVDDHLADCVVRDAVEAMRHDTMTQSAARSDRPQGVTRARILVCEDAIGYRMLIRRWLEDAGVDVVGEATTWAEAEQSAAELQPDAVIADLWMPTLDVEALQRVRAAVPDAAIVSLSGLSAEEAERLVGSTGVIDLFLSKRQPPAEIVDSLRDFVRGRLAAGESPQPG